jgi:GNAT superfamily N-acetyltransferase
VIRPARDADWLGIRATFRAAGRAAWPHIVDADRLDRLEPPARWRNAPCLLVAERDDEVAGFVAARLSADEDAASWTGEIDALYTHPSVWGAGLGRALLAQALDDLRRRGCKEATLWTAEENHRPRRFYETGGWRLDGARRERTHLGSPFVELRYRLRLTEG